MTCHRFSQPRGAVSHLALFDAPLVASDLENIGRTRNLRAGAPPPRRRRRRPRLKKTCYRLFTGSITLDEPRDGPE